MLAEVPTEVTQQMIERAQAGLSLTSPDALKEYGETAYATSLLGPMGIAGRASERAGARQEVEQTAQAKKRETQLAAAGVEEQERQRKAAEDAALEAHKQTDEYAIKFGQDYEALFQQYQQTKPEKPGKNATFEEVDAYKEAVAKRKELGAQLEELTPEYRRIKDKYKAFKTTQEQTAEQKKQRELEQRLKESEFAGPGRQMELPGVERIAPVKKQKDLFGNEMDVVEPEEKADETNYAQMARTLGLHMEELQTRAKASKNLNEKIE